MTESGEYRNNEHRSSVDPFGRMRLNVEDELATGLPLSVHGSHESAHHEVQGGSALGRFQALLCRYLERGQLTELQRCQLEASIGDITRSSATVHEGVAMYCSFVELLRDSPSSIELLMKSAPASQVRALGQVSTLLPRVAPASASTADLYPYRVLAVLLGALLCSPPVLAHYPTPDSFFRDPSAYITVDTPDQMLAQLSEHPEDVRQRCGSVLERIREDQDELAAVFGRSVEEGLQLLQSKWAAWACHFQRRVAVEQLAEHSVMEPELLERVALLAYRWGLAESTPVVPRPTPEWDRGADVLLPGSMALNVTFDASSAEETGTCLRSLLSTTDDYLLCMYDGGELRSESSVEIRSGHDGKPVAILESADTRCIYVVRLTPDLLERRPAATDCVRLVVPVLALEHWAVMLSQRADSQSVWLTDGRRYFQRQCLGGSFGTSGLILPNVLLHFRTAPELAVASETVLPPYKGRIRYAMVDVRPFICLVELPGEFMYALSADGLGERLFAEKMASLGARPLTNSDRDDLLWMTRCMILGHYLLRAVMAREELATSSHTPTESSD